MYQRRLLLGKAFLGVYAYRKVSIAMTSFMIYNSHRHDAHLPQAGSIRRNGPLPIPIPKIALPRYFPFPSQCCSSKPVNEILGFGCNSLTLHVYRTNAEGMEGESREIHEHGPRLLKRKPMIWVVDKSRANEALSLYIDAVSSTPLS